MRMSIPGISHWPRERVALIAALLLILAWGANFSVQKRVFEALSPAGFLFVRYLLMPLAAATLLCWRYGRRWPRISRADLQRLAGLGFVGHVLHVGLVTYGIHWSTAFSSSLILACGPVFTLLILHRTGGEGLDRAQAAGIGLAFVGVLVFLSDKLLGGHWQAGGGDLVLLVAASFFSYYTVMSRPLIQRHGGVVTMTYGTLLGSAPLVLLSAPAAMRVDWLAVAPAVWAGTLYAVLISAFLGWMVWGWVNAVRGVARTAPLMYLMPPVAGAVAWVSSGEHYSGVKIGGAVLTMLGVALAQFAGRNPQGAVIEAPAPVD